MSGPTCDYHKHEKWGIHKLNVDSYGNSSGSYSRCPLTRILTASAPRQETSSDKATSSARSTVPWPTHTALRLL